MQHSCYDNTVDIMNGWAQESLSDFFLAILVYYTILVYLSFFKINAYSMLMLSLIISPIDQKLKTPLFLAQSPTLTTVRPYSPVPTPTYAWEWDIGMRLLLHVFLSNCNL